MSGARIAILLAASLTVQAGELPPEPCFEGEVLHHVRVQFASYGPRSKQNEFFGFIYRKDGRVEGAVTYGRECRGQSDCTVNPAFALARVPKGAKVLGEWHTHPHIGTRELSAADVRGAHANRHIRCYAAFYSSPDGAIYRWSTNATSVPTAMESRTQVGNYRKDPPADAAPPSAAIIAAPEFPGSACLSTSTNAQTADTEMRYCRRLPTSL
jgi:hypothetical protein